MNISFVVDCLIPAFYLSALGLRPGNWSATRWVPLFALVCVVLGMQVWSPATTVMLFLVNFLGGAIISYSENYLRGEKGRERYRRLLLMTLAAINVVVSSENLLVLSIAWFVTSLGLHGLLTYYDERPQALIAAHKKFILSRCADLCLILALICVWSECSTFSLSAIQHSAHSASPVLRVAMFLIALAVILKSALLPVHGWLIQVMEAPTPVSALLHAGIVNLGGFLLIKLQPLLAHSLESRAFLVLAGTLSAVLAGLVLMTRVSIKVRLAWSTCAQMGFLLIECGLGLADLALLHIVGHSLYKAYAFLSAGEVVAETEKRMLLRSKESEPSMVATSFRIACSIVPSFVLIFFAAQSALPLTLHGALGLAIALLGVSPLLWGIQPLRGRAFFGALIVLALYFFWHTIFRSMIATPEPSLALSSVALGGLALLVGLQTWIRTYPKGALSKGLYPWVFGGFYLDEIFTRLTIRWWPPKVRTAHSTPRLLSVLEGGQAS